MKALVWLLIAIVLNSSIDLSHSVRKHGHPAQRTAESIPYNEINTLYELITEVIMGMEDHVTEEEDRPDTDPGLKKTDSWHIAFLVPDIPLHAVSLYTYADLPVISLPSVAISLVVPPPNC